MTAQLFPVTRPDDVAAALEAIAAGRTEFPHRIVTLAPFTLFPGMGGAMHYGSSLRDIINRSMNYVDRILRGAKPGDLPSELPTRYELLFNLKTLRAIGVTVPKSLLVRADEVIE